jgi:hypothetical protein
MVSDSDKHYAYLEDPEDIYLNNEFDGLDEDEVKNLKREYVLCVCLCFAWLTLTHGAKLGTQSHSRSRTQPPHPQLPEEN